MEKEIIETIDSSPVTFTQLNKTEIDIQIATARKYPRSIAKFRQEALTMATMDADIAASCFYKLKRKNADGTQKIIEGPSVRLAEIIGSSWGNLRFGARIIDENDRFVTAQGVAFDIEKNLSISLEVTRRICDKNGRRYSDDMIAVTKNAACAIALRNAIFKVVPFTYAKYIYEQAKKTAVGDAKTTAQRRQQMIEAFGKMDVSVDEILKYCNKPSVEDVGLTEIEDLLGVYTAIKDGDTTIDEQFRPDKGKSSKPSINPADVIVTNAEPISPEKKEAQKQTASVMHNELPSGDPQPKVTKSTTSAKEPVSAFAKSFYTLAAQKGLSVAKANDWLFAEVGYPSAGDVTVEDQARVIDAIKNI